MDSSNVKPDDWRKNVKHKLMSNLSVLADNKTLWLHPLEEVPWPESLIELDYVQSQEEFMIAAHTENLYMAVL